MIVDTSKNHYKITHMTTLEQFQPVVNKIAEKIIQTCEDSELLYSNCYPHTSEKTGDTYPVLVFQLPCDNAYDAIYLVESRFILVDERWRDFDVWQDYDLFGDDSENNC